MIVCVYKIDFCLKCVMRYAHTPTTLIVSAVPLNELIRNWLKQPHTVYSESIHKSILKLAPTFLSLTERIRTVNIQAQPHHANTQYTIPYTIHWQIEQCMAVEESTHVTVNHSQCEFPVCVVCIWHACSFVFCALLSGSLSFLLDLALALAWSRTP